MTATGTTIDIEYDNPYWYEPVETKRYSEHVVTIDFITDMNIRVEENLDKNKSIFENSSEDICLFSKYLLGIDLYAWQIEFLYDIQDSIKNTSDIREFIALTARQLGKTTCLLVIIAWVLIFNKLPVGMSNSTQVAVISATDKQAKKLLKKLKLLLIAGERYMHRTYKGEFTTSAQHELGAGKFFSALLDYKAENNKTVISIKAHFEGVQVPLLNEAYGNSIAESHPPTAGVLGETVSLLIVDEAGRHDLIDDDFFTDELNPIGDHADAISIYTSTPWGPLGYFYERCDPNKEFFSEASLYCYSIEALKNESHEGAKRQYKKAQKRISDYEAAGKHDTVTQVYYCGFVKGALNYFDLDRVSEMFDEDLIRLQEFEGPCDIGVDFGGQVKSKTSITISRLNEDTGHITRLFEKHYPVKGDDDLLDDIALLMTRFNIQRVVVDDCPAGHTHIRTMERDLGWTVTRMQFSTSKVQKYGAFRVKLNKGLLSSYPDRPLKTEMNNLQQSSTATRSQIKVARNKTDDIIDSFVISCYNFLDDKVHEVGFIDWENYG